MYLAVTFWRLKYLLLHLQNNLAPLFVMQRLDIAKNGTLASGGSVNFGNQYLPMDCFMLGGTLTAYDFSLYAENVTIHGILSVTNFIASASNATIGGSLAAYNFTLFAETATVMPNASISTTGTNLGPNMGSGTMTTTFASAGGAGHGGSGGANMAGGIHGKAYGSAFFPTTPGSDGALSAFDVTAGGKGGGVVRISVQDYFIFNGSIMASGTTGVGRNGATGGSGGSIWITAGTISGNGTISSNGGAGTYRAGYYGGSGSGGRIALYFHTNDSFNGVVTAYGGLGTTVVLDGSAGTILTKDMSANFTVLTVDNVGRSSIAASNAAPITFQNSPGLAAWITEIDTASFFFDELRFFGKGALAFNTSSNISCYHC